MPGKVAVKIKAGRNLPIMDKSRGTTDALLEIKLANLSHRTEICYKSLNPQWNHDWIRFEVDDAELQDEPLQIRVIDYDMVTTNNPIGKINISLVPLCLEVARQSNKGRVAVMSGWIPVFDTMHGLRGEIHVNVKLELFSDSNKFRQSSCGVPFFHSPGIPHGYRATSIHGFVEELVVNYDPEYQWINNIRTSRASNEARQVVFLKLSAQVQRRIGLKAINLGANAVIGYTKSFDLEGDIGVVARGIGTAVTLVKIQEISAHPATDNALVEERTLKYLEFLKGGVDTNYRNVFDEDVYCTRSGDLVKQALGIVPLDKCTTQVPSLIVTKKWRPSPKEQIIIEEDADENNEGMKNLLEQEDMRGEKRLRRLKHHVKRITRSSRNILSGKFNVFKSKLNDDNKIDQDGPSLNSSNSDVSYSGGSHRSSIIDIKERRKLHKEKDLKFSRSISDGSGMATVLVRSLMHGPSLDSISEGHDSAKSSPSLCLTPKNDVKSMTNLSQIDIIDKKQLLLLENKVVFKTSDISMSTVSLSSTTTEGFSDEDESETTQNDIGGIDADTVSMVVKTVLARESLEKDSQNCVQPVVTQHQHEQQQPQQNNNINIDKVEKNSPKILHQISSDSSDELVKNAAAVKQCILTGATRILKMDKDSKITEMELMETHTTSDNLDRMLESPSIDKDKDNWIEPGSTTDEPETIDKERRGSLMHNISEKLHHLQEHIHVARFTEEKNKIHENSMVESAMETMLMERAQMVGAQSTKKSTDDNDDELEYKDEKAPNPKKSVKWHKNLIVISKKFHFPFCHKNKKEIKNESGLLSTAMKTMLMEQVNIAEEICEHPDEINKERKSIISASSSASSKSKNDEKSKKEDFIGQKTINPGTLSNKLSNDEPERKKESKNIIIPAISLTTGHHPQQQLQQPSNTIRVEDKNNSFYSSQPELNLFDNLSPPVNLLGMPFMSLTNLNISTNSLVSKLDNTNPPSSSLPPKPNPLSFSAFDLKRIDFVKKNPSCNLVAKMNATTMPRMVKPTKTKTTTATTTTTITKETRNNLQIARNNVLSSSYTNLSTNKAPMLAPFPFLKHRRSELASGAASSPSGRLPIGHSRADSSGGAMSQSPAKAGQSAPINTLTATKDSGIHRRSSDSDLSITPKGNSICATTEQVFATNMMSMTQENLDILEYPFLTMTKYPAGFIVQIGGIVNARSVKLLERVANPDEPQTRDTWWKEIRMEIRSHLRAYRCNVVLGYSETTAICDDVCILTGTGTAAVVNMKLNNEPYVLDLCSALKKEATISSLEERDDTAFKNAFEVSLGLGGIATLTTTKILPPTAPSYDCTLCHIPYSIHSPFNIEFQRCAVCKRKMVPPIIMASIELPDNLQITGRGCFIQAQTIREKKDIRSEMSAKVISDGLPFLEYDANKLLINKLKAKGMNAIFGMKVQVAAGENLMALTISGTAVYVTALSDPTIPQIGAGNPESHQSVEKVKNYRKAILETVIRNREIYQLKPIDVPQSYSEEYEDEHLELDLTAGDKNACVLEVDDVQDMEVINNLMEPCPAEGFHVVNTESVPGLHDLEVARNLIQFSHISRVKLPATGSKHFPEHFQNVLQTVLYKLRALPPCAICDFRFRMVIPDEDTFQLLVTGMALGLEEPSAKARRKTLPTSNSSSSTNKNSSNDEELIFTLDEDQNNEHLENLPSTSSGGYGLYNSLKTSCSPPTADQKLLKSSLRFGVEVTPLSYVPGGRIERYIGNLAFFFIRESTSVRENGGISGFAHCFITELLAVVRAHVTALGGNTITSFYMSELLLGDNPHKDQAQSIISVGGDVVYVSYPDD